jgi:phosphoribosylformylglycinamidine synthase
MISGNHLMLKQQIMKPLINLLDLVALTKTEYVEIVNRLGREPNDVELGMFGSMWSEHCGYKHSKQLLQLLPSESPRLLAKPGAENAGAIDIGDGLAVVFKIESHNHPSAVEPNEGAATGVGGIVRDILAMGARPIALLNSLRFGPLTKNRNRYLMNGVVSGISSYGNCIGVPNVGGEIIFGETYGENPLVNALCVGIVKTDCIVKSAARTPGNFLVLVGAETGRDGIHGASGLASRGFQENQKQRPAVQVGNPFLEKILIEACLETAHSGLIEGMQDLGAAGLTSSVVESAFGGGSGFRLDISKIPLREEGMTPYEVMLSESQERMLLIVSPDKLKSIQEIMQRWDTPCTVIGEVTNDQTGHVIYQDKEVATIPLKALANPPLYELEGTIPPELTKLQSYDLTNSPPYKATPNELLLNLLGSPNITSKKSVYRQYDHQVQINTLVGPGEGDAAVLRVKGTNKALAISTDGNGRVSYLDPFIGGAFAVAEACRNLVCTGAEPLAITNCLNFGNPEKNDVAYQLKESVRGIVAACTALALPVVSGNVSLYNESNGQPIYPTPVIGALGLLEDASHSLTSAFKKIGDVVVLLGKASIDAEEAGLAGSEILDLAHKLVAGSPTIDLDLEARVQKCCLKIIHAQLIHSAHDCSEGGLAITLAESAIQGDFGFKGTIQPQGRWDAALYGESPSRIIISLPKTNIHELDSICKETQVPYTVIGTVQKDQFIIPGLIDLEMSTLRDAWDNGFEDISREQNSFHNKF